MNYAARLNRLRQLMHSVPCDALIIEYPIDLFYLTGIELSAGKLLVSQKETCFIVDGRYFESSCQQTLYPVQLLKDHSLKDWLITHSIHHLGFDKNQTTYHGFLTFSQLAADLNAAFYTLEVVPVASLVQQLRMVKDQEEINCLRTAASFCYRGYEFVVSQLCEGITEAELAFELEFFWKKQGASRLAFDSIIAFGPNSSKPHHRASLTKLQPSTSILIDIGAVLSHYHSDMSRVVYFGTPPDAIQAIYPIVEEAKNRAFELCRPGVLIGELDRVARGWITSQGYGEYFTHSLGHAVGLEIHEPPIIREKGPFSTQLLQAGMVLTIEPGIYLPGIGGVRLEDTILITENGYENLTL